MQMKKRRSGRQSTNSNVVFIPSVAETLLVIEASEDGDFQRVAIHSGQPPAAQANVIELSGIAAQIDCFEIDENGPDHVVTRLPTRFVPLSVMRSAVIGPEAESLVDYCVIRWRGWRADIHQRVLTH